MIINKANKTMTSRVKTSRVMREAHRFAIKINRCYYVFANIIIRFTSAII